MADQKAVGWFTRTLAILLALIGVVLAVGGVWLAMLGGSWFYLLAGALLLVSAFFVWRGSALGAWIYCSVVLLSWICGVSEVGLHGWPLVPWIVAPSVLLMLLLFALPSLEGAKWSSNPLLRFGSFALYVALVWTVLAVANRPNQAGALPAYLAMNEPAQMKTGADWPAYGGTYSGRRFSPLTQINYSNVGGLQRVWTFHTGDLPPANLPNAFAAETTPLKIGDTLYLCSANDIVIALDPATGRERWRYDPHVAHASIPYSATCRGVSYFRVPSAAPGALCAERIFVGTLDARLIAVDAKTGLPCPDFGQGGQIDTSAHMGRVPPGMVSITSAPTIVRGVVVVGHQVLDNQRRDAPSGVVLAYDAITGQKRWSWDLGRVPGNAPLGPDEIYTRGTPNMWTTAAADEQLGLVYLPLGNVADDYWSGGRTPLENRYSSSIVAVNAETGAEVWSFQTVHMDVWDYDLGSQPTLIDYPTASGGVPAIIVPSKQGDLYILDRRNGRPLTQVSEQRAPQGGVEASLRAPTQPHSLFQTLAGRTLRESDMWGMSPIDQMICRIQFRQASYQGIYTPPTSARSYIEYPSYNGGSDWGSVAVDPLHGLLIANYNDMANYDRPIPRGEANARGIHPRDETHAQPGAESPADPQEGVPYAIGLNPGWRLGWTQLPCTRPPFGGIRAIDIRTGRVVWDRPLGQARNNGPFGIPMMLPINIGTPNNGGPVVTAGGLVFVAAATDNLIRAIDIRTGRTIWSDTLPAGGQATPMTYEVDGRQYLVIMAGGHHFMKTKPGDALVAYALPGATRSRSIEIHPPA